MGIMNPEIKTKWLEALRSGEYKQGKGALARREEDGTVGYCCLGVLCDLAEKEGVVSNYETSEGPTTATKRRYYTSPGADYGDSVYLPHEVRDWASINAHNPVVDVDGRPVNVASMNDDGATFSEIADFIERHF